MWYTGHSSKKTQQRHASVEAALVYTPNTEVCGELRSGARPVRLSLGDVKNTRLQVPQFRL